MRHEVMGELRVIGEPELATAWSVTHIGEAAALATGVHPGMQGSSMGSLRNLWLAAFLALVAGCQSGASFIEGPALHPGGAGIIYDQNPVFIPLGPESYGHVFESCLRVLGDYGFEIQESNRYDGRIECFPRISPGIGLLCKPGSPDLYDRLLATAQTYRHRLSLAIQPADNGGFFIEVTARKELEDLARPVRSTVGGAIFRTDNNVERQFEVIDPTFFDAGWIYRGRDEPLEQEIIRRLKKCM